MYKLKELNPPWKEFYVVFCKVQFLALHCLIYFLMTFSSILEFTLFADDTNIIYSHDSTTSLCNTLNAELKKLNAWLNLNKLSFNLQKTYYITFSTNNSDSTIQLAINGLNIKKVNSTKYLGVYIDHHLKWKDHIAYISSKLS